MAAQRLPLSKQSNMSTETGTNSSTHGLIRPHNSKEPPDLIKAGEKALRAANKVNRHITEHSTIYSAEAKELIPRFERSELLLGELLGCGGFNTVSEVSAIILNPDPSTSKYADTLTTDIQVQQRQAAASLEGSPYAIKCLNQKTLEDPDRYCIGSADLVLEAKLLSSLNHPHIIKLRGISAAGTAGVALCQEFSYFLLLDRLQTTLSKRIDVWKQEQQEIEAAQVGVRKLLWMTGAAKKREKELLAQRLRVALSVAEAMAYLHHHRVIYRDLKPENIGFDLRDTVVLFDFGLSKELKPSDTYDEKFHLTGHTGSLRFMAPEVARYLPYNLSADCYSFGILLWHLYSLEMPFEGMSKSAHSHMVVYGGQRPKVDLLWPASIRTLLKDSWEEAPYKRPRMPQFVDALRHELAQCEEKRRGAPFVLNRDAISERPRSTPTKKGLVEKVFSRHGASGHPITAA